MSSAISQSQKYASAMLAGRHSECLRIEQSFCLDGLPPELVSVGLRAIDEGKCADAAISEYVRNDRNATGGAA